MIPIFSDLIELLTDFFRGRPQGRKSGVIAAVSLVIISAPLWVLSVILADRGGNNPAYGVPALVFDAAALVLIVAILASYRPGTARPPRNTEEQLALIANARDEIEREIRQTGGGDVYSNLELNLNQISEYYTINKSQARNSFRIGASAVILGFGTILAGVGMVYFKDGSAGTSLTVPILTSVAGVIGQFIGAYCFYLYNQSSKQVATFYGRLSQVQDTMLAVKLCDMLEDQSKRGSTIVRIISALIARSGYNLPTPDDATTPAEDFEPKHEAAAATG